MRGLLRFLLWISILIGLVVGLLRVTAIRWLRLPSNDPIFEASVAPTLQGGDLILLWRLGKPGFADLVLCPEPDAEHRYIIGRIMGTPGDLIEFKDSKPQVNSKGFLWERTCDPVYFELPNPDDATEIVKQQCEMEDVAGHLHMTGITDGHNIEPEDLSFDVPQGKYFLVSDNRLFPYDSRAYGFVDIDSCKEMVIGRLVSKKGWKDSKNRLKYIE